MKSLSECPIGSIVKERVENYKAMVVGHQIHIDGCHRVVLQECSLKDGKPVGLESTDLQRVDLVKFVDGYVMKPVDDIIGLKAKDLATEYTGTICIVGMGIAGDIDYFLQTAERAKGGDRVDGIWVAEARVKLLEPRRVIAPPKKKKKKNEPLQAGRGPVDAPMKSSMPS